MKFARKIGRPAGRFEFVCFERAFHGRTMGALAATWNPKYREPFEPLVPGVRFVPWNDLAAAAAWVTDKTAAVLVETVQGEGGVRPAAPDFLRGLRDLCRERGALLVLDEVQCGLGRTGRLFAFEHAAVTPDLLALAKPLGGGLPMGAILIRDELASALVPGDHGSTFGGNPVAAAASLAVLDHLTRPGFLPGVARRGASLMRGLLRLARAHPDQIAEVRGIGLMVGVELRGEAGEVVKRLRERGFLTTKAGDKVLRLLPPLVVRPAAIKSFLAALDDVLKELPPAAEGAAR
jgi:acetylornithine/succinyldiaminopimelate/putrescine aminotransferase